MLLLLLAGLVLLLAAAVIGWPLVFGALESHIIAAPHEGEYAESDALLEALSELELAHGSGKLSQQDYDNQKLRLQKQYLQAVQATTPQGGKGPGKA
jgi:hypothetical protein